MALKSKELTLKVKRVVVDLTTQGLSGKHIEELLDIQPRSVENFLKRLPWAWIHWKCSSKWKEKRCTRRDTWTLLRNVRSNRRSTLKDVTAKFNNRAIFNYSIRSIRRQLFDSRLNAGMCQKKNYDRSIQSGKTTLIL